MFNINGSGSFTDQAQFCQKYHLRILGLDSTTQKKLFT